MAKNEPTHSVNEMRAALRKHQTISFTRDAGGLLTISGIPADIPDEMIAQTFDRVASQRYRNCVSNKAKGNATLAATAKKQEIALLAIAAHFTPAIREAVDKAVAKAAKKKPTTKSGTAAATIDA